MNVKLAAGGVGSGSVGESFPPLQVTKNKYPKLNIKLLLNKNFIGYTE